MYEEDKITVYTPTYNRGYCLHKLYNSLLSQTDVNFEWVIIDDGSSDNTKEIVQQWISDDRISIKYYYQENKGKQEAVNFAHSLIRTELNACVDSDDYLVDDAIEYILKTWRKIKDDKNIAGIVGLDVYQNGTVVGSRFPDNLKTARFTDFAGKYNIKGDKKFVYKTEIIHKYPPYPSISGEKFPAPGYLYRLIDVDYTLFVTNKVLCVVEYLPDGISKNKFKQFMNSPNSFAFYRLERMRLANRFGDRFKNAVHYVSSCRFAKKSIFTNNPYPFITALALPFGILLNLYIRNTNKGGLV